MARRGKELWLVALVCFGPFALAMLAYYGPWGLDWLPVLPGSRELFEPAPQLPALELTGPAGQSQLGAPESRWSLIYARIADCEEQCARHLERLQQVHLALGRDADRVQRVLLHGRETAYSDADAGLLTGRLTGERGAAVIGLLGEDRIREGRIFVADPSGHLVVSYPADVEQKELLRDVERLLDVSGGGQ